METREIINSKQREILALKNRLTANCSDIGDYKIIKSLEAKLKNEPAPYDTDELIAEREAARQKINDLQDEIDKLEKEGN